MRRREFVTLIALLSACEPSTGGVEGNRSGTIAFQNAQVLPAVTPPFVTILDTADLTVLRASDSARLQFLGKSVRSRDTVADFPIELPTGELILQGRLLTTQGNRPVLSDGSVRTRVDQDQFLVTIAVVPRVPILLVAPDTVRYTQVGTALVYDTIYVHNRGTGQLTWSVSDTNPPLNQLPCRGPCMMIKPNTGVVGPGMVQIVRLDSIQSVAPAFTLTFLSSFGQVPVVVRRTP